MKSINAMYAHLQQTSWKDYATTTLGHLSAEKYNEIEAAYAKQIASETAQETATTTPPTPEVEFPTGDSMNSSIGATTPSETVSSDSAAGDTSIPNGTESNDVGTVGDVPVEPVQAEGSDLNAGTPDSIGENDAFEGQELASDIKSPDDLVEEAAQAETVVIEGEAGKP